MVNTVIEIRFIPMVVVSDSVINIYNYKTGDDLNEEMEKSRIN